jgi:hypothetical protein
VEPIEIDLGISIVVIRENSSQLRSDLGSDHSDRIEPIVVVTLEEAQRIVGFKIWQPTFFPFLRITLEKAILLNPAEGTCVISKYRNDSGNWMVVRQQPLATSLQTIPVPFPITERRIAGRPAVFFNHTVTATSEPAGQLQLICCLWEHEGYLMELEAPYVSEEVLIQVAESLA